jgi:hypothetical protein
MTTLVIVSAVWCAVLLAASVARALARGGPRVRAVSRGRAAGGLVYAFGPAMRPWAKDGVRGHPLVLVAGLVYHLGVAVALVLLAGVLLAGWRGDAWPAAARLGLGLLLVFAASAGLALFVRRVRDPVLRRISVPDDLVSNMLVDVFLLASVAWLSTAVAESFLLVAASLLLLYAPLGKIRHCAFYPFARVAFGVRLGRRGIAGGRAFGSGA